MKNEKPTPEAKALSLFLMAYKSKDPIYKERLKSINRLWDLFKDEELTREEYDKEVQTMLDEYGGYQTVLEKTVRYYIEKTGEWKLEGSDTYSKDAKKVASQIKAE